MDRLFTLDAQFLFDAVVLGLSMLLLFYRFFRIFCLIRSGVCLKSADSVFWMIRRLQSGKNRRQSHTKKSMTES